MQTLLKITLFLIPIFFASCSSKMYYQLYDVEAEKTSKTQDQKNAFAFNKDSLTVTYNFWGENGNLAFVVQNHSASYAYIDLKESYFTVNGWTQSYYDQATYAISKSTSTEVNEAASFANMLNPNQRNTLVFGEKSSKEVETSFKEKEKIGIPPQSKKQFLKFNLKNSMHTDCDLNLNPKESDTLSFKKDMTPLRFQNIIHYAFKNSEKPSGFIENKFWTKAIININGDNFSTTDSRAVCENRRADEEISVNPHSAPNRFYLGYEGDRQGSFALALGIFGLAGLGILIIS